MEETEHWHPILIEKHGEGQYIALPATRHATASEAKATVMERFNLQLDRMRELASNDEERAQVEALREEARKDAADEDGGFILVLGDEILGAYDCQGGNSVECATFSQHVSRQFIGVARELEEKCGREEHEGDVRPMTGMYL